MKVIKKTYSSKKKFSLLVRLQKRSKNMDIEDAIKAVQIKAGLEDETIDFLLCYKYGEELLIKLAEAMI